MRTQTPRILGAEGADVRPTKRWILCGIAFVATLASTFLTYGALRGGISEQFGFEPNSVVLYSLVALLLPGCQCVPVPPVIAVLVGYLVLLAWEHLLPECRFPKHPAGTRCCIECGYPATGLPDEHCPECSGHVFMATRPPRVRDGRRLALMLLLGWLGGCALAEAYISTDELAFRREALASGQPLYSRARWYPNANGGLVYDRGTFRATD